MTSIIDAGQIYPQHMRIYLLDGTPVAGTYTTSPTTVSSVSSTTKPNLGTPGSTLVLTNYYGAVSFAGIFTKGDYETEEYLCPMLGMFSGPKGATKGIYPIVPTGIVAATAMVAHTNLQHLSSPGEFEIGSASAGIYSVQLGKPGSKWPKFPAIGLTVTLGAGNSSIMGFQYHVSVLTRLAKPTPPRPDVPPIVPNIEPPILMGDTIPGDTWDGDFASMVYTLSIPPQS